MSKTEIDGGSCVEEQTLVTKKEGRKRLRIPSSSEDLQKCCLWREDEEPNLWLCERCL